MGEVGAPGRYDLERPVDVLQALAIAGGPGAFAARNRIQVRRQAADGERVMLFDYESLEDGATPRQLVELRDGDVIIVPERGLFD
jgi:polysaccharide export outer membrane protein